MGFVVNDFWWWSYPSLLPKQSTVQNPASYIDYVTVRQNTAADL